MSASLHDTGLFTSRKRRTGEVADGFKDGAKRPLTVEKIRYAGGESSSSASPVAIAQKAAGAVAPKSKGSAYVQKAIHEEVQYSPEGKGGVPEKTLEVFRFVKKSFVIPQDFEKDHEYGPLSGVSHEVRVVSAYMSGQLKARSGADASVKMCLECGKQGHFPRYCPAVFQQ